MSRLLTCGRAASKWSARPGAARARRLVGRPEHQVVDEKLRAPVEQLYQRLLPVLGVEDVLLVDAHPRELLALLRDLLVEPPELLLALQELPARRRPLFHRSDRVFRHGVPSLGDVQGRPAAGGKLIGRGGLVIGRGRQTPTSFLNAGSSRIGSKSESPFANDRSDSRRSIACRRCSTASSVWPARLSQQATL